MRWTWHTERDKLRRSKTDRIKDTEKSAVIAEDFNTNTPFVVEEYFTGDQSGYRKPEQFYKLSRPNKYP